MRGGISRVSRNVRAPAPRVPIPARIWDQGLFPNTHLRHRRGEILHLRDLESEAHEQFDSDPSIIGQAVRKRFWAEIDHAFSDVPNEREFLWFLEHQVRVADDNAKNSFQQRQINNSHQNKIKHFKDLRYLDFVKVAEQSGQSREPRRLFELLLSDIRSHFSQRALEAELAVDWDY